jgi:hypothetical protein
MMSNGTLKFQIAISALNPTSTDKDGNKVTKYAVCIYLEQL